MRRKLNSQVLLKGQVLFTQLFPDSEETCLFARVVPGFQLSQALQ